MEFWRTNLYLLTVNQIGKVIKRDGVLLRVMVMKSNFYVAKFKIMYLSPAIEEKLGD